MYSENQTLELVVQPRSLRDIRRDMHRQREWRNELERMKIGAVVGCLFVDSKSLRNELSPTTAMTLDKIKGLLLAMARATCLQVSHRNNFISFWQWSLSEALSCTGLILCGP
jgi:hypothetical protein